MVVEKEGEGLKDVKPDIAMFSMDIKDLDASVPHFVHLHEHPQYLFVTQCAFCVLVSSFDVSVSQTWGCEL